MRCFNTNAVVHEILYVIVVNTIALVTRLFTRLRAFLRGSFRTFGRATGFRINHIVKEPSVQRAEQKVIAENARLESPMQTIVIRSSAQSKIVRRNFQVRSKTAQLHITHRVIPQGVSVNRNANIEFTRFVGKVRLEFTVVPGFDIFAKRRFHQEMKIFVARAETEFKEWLDMFFVTATVFKRNAKPTPIISVTFSSVHRIRRLSKSQRNQTANSQQKSTNSHRINL